MCEPEQWQAMDLTYYKALAERLQGELDRLTKPQHPDDRRPNPGYSEGYKEWRQKRMQHAD